MFRICFNLDRKLALVIFVAALSSVSSQNLTFDCSFFDQWNGYGCTLNNITVADPSQNVTFGGQHIGNRTNADVAIVRVINSNTPFVVQQIFTTFSNINVLHILDSRLQSISLPNSVQFVELSIQGNNITGLQNGTFINQSQLTYLNLRYNNIEEINEDAFVGLVALESLVLIGNRVRSLAPRTFHPLTNVTYLDLQRNFLSRISDELFLQNTQMRNLYLEYNYIEAITPRFIAKFGNNLSYINLSGNICINRSFSLNSDDDFSRILIHNALRTCFNNFNGTTSRVRHITLEFEGPLRLFDEFGNLIINVPQ